MQFGIVRKHSRFQIRQNRTIEDAEISTQGLDALLEIPAHLPVLFRISNDRVFARVDRIIIIEVVFQERQIRFRKLAVNPVKIDFHPEYGSHVRNMRQAVGQIFPVLGFEFPRRSYQGISEQPRFHFGFGNYAIVNLVEVQRDNLAVARAVQISFGGENLRAIVNRIAVIVDNRITPRLARSLPVRDVGVLYIELAQSICHIHVALAVMVVVVHDQAVILRGVRGQIGLKIRYFGRKAAYDVAGRAKIYGDIPFARILPYKGTPRQNLTGKASFRRITIEGGRRGMDIALHAGFLDNADSVPRIHFPHKPAHLERIDNR